MWGNAETPSPVPGTAVSGSVEWWVPLLILSGIMLAAFLGLLGARQIAKDDSPVANSVVRAWIAITLVGGLLLMGLLMLGGSDSDLRNLVIGAVVTAAGTSVAFYFATKANEDANKTLLSAVGDAAKGGFSVIGVNAIGVNDHQGNISYSFKITNHSSETLTDVELIDSVLTPDRLSPAWPDPANEHVLKGGESATITGSYKIQEADLAAGWVQDRATASATKPSGEKVMSLPEVTVTQLLVGAGGGQGGAPLPASPPTN